jgi:hypothetical protein
MSVFGVLKGLFSVGIAVYGVFKGKENKPTVMEVLPTVVGQLLPAVQSAIKYQNMTTKAQLDAWLETLDASMGEEAGAVDIIHDMPSNREEELSDHLLAAARIYGYNLLGVEGY